MLNVKTFSTAPIQQIRIDGPLSTPAGSAAADTLSHPRFLARWGSRNTINVVPHSCDSSPYSIAATYESLVKLGYEVENISNDASRAL